LIIFTITAQERVDGTFDFQTNPAKQYSIFTVVEFERPTGKNVSWNQKYLEQ